MCTYVLLLHQKYIDIIMINNLLFYDNGVRLSESQKEQNQPSERLVETRMAKMVWYGTEYKFDDEFSAFGHDVDQPFSSGYCPLYTCE
jgi:hypothetical protein